MRTVYIDITKNQRRFIEWCATHNKVRQGEHQCVYEVLLNGKYLEDGNWRDRLNALRDRHLNEYLKFKDK